MPLSLKLQLCVSNIVSGLELSGLGKVLESLISRAKYRIQDML